MAGPRGSRTSLRCRALAGRATAAAACRAPTLGGLTRRSSTPCCRQRPRDPASTCTSARGRAARTASSSEVATRGLSRPQRAAGSEAAARWGGRIRAQVGLRSSPPSSDDGCAVVHSISAWCARWPPRSVRPPYSVARLASLLRAGEELLECESIGWQIDQQIARDDDRLTADERTATQTDIVTSHLEARRMRVDFPLDGDALANGKWRSSARS